VLFNSPEFVLFAPLVLLGHAALSGRALRLWLICASYLFYGWGEPWYCLLLAFSTALDYTAALRIHASDRAGVRKAWLLASVAGNLGMLGVFKYSGLFLRWAGALLGAVGVEGLSISALETSVRLADVALPVGISFYTFQTLSYTIDVYRRQLTPTRDFTAVALYVAFFPQLVAGPIERAGQLLPQLSQKQRRSADDLIAGATRVLWGLVKKAVFADWFAVFVADVWGTPETATPLELFLGLHAFSFQLYLDFSAYSDIAIGLARMMGIRLRENFRWPFLSRNPVEFWTRWHISLTTWVRDYVYVPLGGSNLGRNRTLFNSLIVMLAIGLWHGADEKFLVWGLVHWVYDSLYRAWVNKRGTRWYRGKPYAWSDAPAVLFTYFLVIPQVFFGAPSLSHAWVILQRVFSPWGGPLLSRPEGRVAVILALLGVAATAHILRGLDLDRRLRAIRSPLAVGLLWAGLIALIAVGYAPDAEQFYYFRF